MAKNTPPEDVHDAEIIEEPTDTETVSEAEAEVVLEQTDEIPDNVDPTTGEVDETTEAVVDDPHPVSAVLTLLPTSSDPREWSDEQKALLDAAGLVSRKGGQVIPAPRATIAAFLSQCHRTQLDPIARQIYCVERGGKWTIQISIDGFRLIAERSGGYRGQSAPQWTADGETWVDVWLRKEPPAAARIAAHRDGFTEPVWGVATYEGYCPRDRNGNLDPKNQWKTNPANQLLKCAEMLALRKAFPHELSGLYGTEEMDQSERTNAVAPRTAAPARAITGDQGDIAMGQQHPVTPAVVDPADVGAEKWQLWKDRIDAAATMLQLIQVRNEMHHEGLLNLPVPGTDKKVSDYFEHRRVQLSTPTTDAAARLQQGLKMDAAS